MNKAGNITLSKVTAILTDIRFWILFFFLIRLLGIGNAPLEIGHSWRQSLTNMIARNFFDSGLHLLYPTIDMAGEKAGIIGSEFPFFNSLIYLVSAVFDYSHWYGRLINLIVSSYGLYYFYRLIKELLDKRVAFNATIILTTSIWFGFSRKIMPDTFSVSLVIIGLYYAYNFIKTNRLKSLLAFFIFSTLGLLCKIPALSIFSILAVLIFVKEIPKYRIVTLYATAALSFTIACIWYFYWVPYLVDKYQFQLYFPKGLVEGIKEIIPLIPEALEKFYFSSLYSYVGFACFLAGVYIVIRSKNQKLKLGLGIVTLVFFLFILKTGSVFPLHNYYIIPFTPIMALVAGIFLAKIPVKIQYILLCVIAIEAIANQQHGFFIKDSQKYKLELEGIADKTIDRGDLIVINGGPSPQDIYFSHRKGWTVGVEKPADQHFIDSLSNLGARFLIVDKSNFSGDNLLFPLEYSDEHYSIYSLNKPN